MPTIVTPDDGYVELQRGDVFDENEAEWELQRKGVFVDLAGGRARLVVQDGNDAVVLDVDTDGPVGNRLVIVAGKARPDITEVHTKVLAVGRHRYDIKGWHTSGWGKTIVRDGVFRVWDSRATD